ncbi:MAG: class II 3-deoxy-7-phosphoheptulonate synthase [Gammaproteobacteria bacterium]
MKKWNLDSWQHVKNHQQPINYTDKKLLQNVINNLKKLPPLVTSFEVDTLKQQLAVAAKGEAFLLQGGDCAESFDKSQPEVVTNKLKILLQMSLVLIHGLNKPIIRVGRIAGQYAKPRSADTETRDGVALPSYRGDLINKPGFSNEERQPNPELMLKGYNHSAVTLNYIRALVHGGFADLRNPEYWDLNFSKDSPLAEQYRQHVKSIQDALNFARTISLIPLSNLTSVDFYTSHEALNLYYEQALTHQAEDGRWYDLSTHFPWIGMRTAGLDGAHVEFFRGLANPIAVKIGPTMTDEHLKELLEILNPENEPGRLTLIVRLGAKKVGDQLPRLIEIVKKSKKIVVWSCDPMHGNTETTQDGIKTRHFDDILNELQSTFRIHHELKTHMSGVHFELTGENVTECVGGASGLTEDDLTRAYESLVDPRLNYEQALELALLITSNKTMYG